ncbi:MAG: hypothetical protein K9M75_08190 [Phycisphaerae bacterium]|nr:hypothetical protein [Phycisphaerae bacterium]
MRKTALIACVILVMSGPAWSFSGSGLGSFRRPYIITNVTQLQEMADELDANYVLRKNIDASETSGWNDGMGFKPVGSWADGGTKKFVGTFDGRGHKITGLFINRPNDSSIGLFGAVGINGKIMNLDLSDVEVSGYQGTGSVVGSLAEGTVINCKSSGKVTCAYYYGGGMCGGTGNTARLINSSSSCKVSGYRYTGGFCGIMNGTSTRCFATGEVFGSYGYTGGFVGNSSYGTMKQCYATGDVTSTISNAGGFMGGTTRGDYIIDQCYATGNVESKSGQTGGFIGDNTTGVITNCYATGNASGTVHIGGFVGINHGPLLHCYSTGKVSSSNGDHRIGGFCGTDKTTSSRNAEWKNVDLHIDIDGGLLPTVGSNNTINDESLTLKRLTGTSGAPVRRPEKPPVTSTGSIKESYYDSENSGQRDSGKGIGKTTDQMNNSATFKGFDFYTVWQIDENECPPVFKWMLAPPPSISIDITPGNCFNDLDVTAKGLLTVAITGTKEFDVSKVDIATIRLQGVSPIRSNYADVSCPATPDRCCRIPDGIKDLTLKFDKHEIIATVGKLKNSTDNTEIKLTLTCTLIDDEYPWKATDYVRIQKPQEQKKK